MLTPGLPKPPDAFIYRQIRCIFHGEKHRIIDWLTVIMLIKGGGNLVGFRRKTECLISDFFPNAHAGPAIHAEKTVSSEIAWNEEFFQLFGWTSYSLFQRQLIKLFFAVTFRYRSNCWPERMSSVSHKANHIQ